MISVGMGIVGVGVRWFVGSNRADPTEELGLSTVAVAFSQEEAWPSSTVGSGWPVTDRPS